jgi:hypothetical protein
MMFKSRLAPVLLALLLVPAVLITSAGTPALAAGSPTVVAKYYAWYDWNSWTPGQLPDLPVEPYLSYERATIERHVKQAKSAGIDAFSLNWLGPANPTDVNLQTLLTVAKANSFAVTVDFDMNSPWVNNGGDVANHLNYLKRYMNDKAWLRYEGRPVVFFYGNRRFDIGTWAAIREQVDPAGATVWMGEGDIFSYLQVFDGIHPYSIAWAGDPAQQLASYAGRARSYPGRLWAATVMPGYDDTRTGRGAAGFARDRENGAYYRYVWEGALATRPEMIVITSWNEWAEGSYIEPSVAYGQQYLQLTRELVDRTRKASSSSSYQMASE